MSSMEELIRKHERMRRKGLNLVASENCLSVKVRKVLSTDLSGRYHSDYYGGSEFARKIIEETEKLAKELFNAEYAIVTPPSGNIAVLAAVFAFTEPFDKVALLPFEVGGYPLNLEKFHRYRIDIPTDKRTFRIDLSATERLLLAEDVKLLILGSSYLLFPHPVEEISNILKDYTKGKCVYDGSHTLGLIACGEFQDPIREGAEVLFGSTHKTFYGPQGGVVLTNSKNVADELRTYLELDLESGIGLVDNPHMNRIAALGIAIEELLKDRTYGERVIQNAKTLARALDEAGVPVRFKDRDYTESHQILLDLDEKRAELLCRQLESVGIFIDVGGRLGTAEITHRGMNRSEMERVAELIAEVYSHGPSERVRKAVEGEDWTDIFRGDP